MRDFSLSPHKPKALDPEWNPWWWNPARLGVEKAPHWFAEKVEAISPDLSVTRNPLTSKWQVWAKNPRMQHPVCQGWRLLFVQDERLDERLLARLYAIDSTKNGGAKAYFDRIQAEVERDKAQREKQAFQDTLDIAMERGWDHSRISTAGTGSKFSRFHA